MKVFITGSTGFVGGHMLSSLRDAGHSIHALVRIGSEIKLPFLEGVTVIYGDIADPEAWAARLKGMDAVIHLVGIIREFPREGVTFERMHFEATRNILGAAKQNGVRRYIHMSANGVSENGVSQYQTTKRRAEKLVEKSGLSWTIFRPSVIFGDSGDKMEFTRELATIISKAPVMPIFGDGAYQMEPVSVEDVAACFVNALTEPKSENRIFHLGGGTPLSYYDVVQTIGKAVGKVRTKTVNVPFWMVKPVAALMGGFKFFPVTVDQLNMLRQGNVCPEHDYKEVFGIEPKPFTYKNLGYLGE